MPLPEHLGRIRLNELEAETLYRLLTTERFHLLYLRQAALAEADDVHAYQRQLVHLKKIRQELVLLADQKGWTIGQPLDLDAEGADSALPTSTDGGVG